jgi:hypothetical protein
MGLLPKVDAVYPLRERFRTKQDEDLFRYSLRSLATYGTGVKKVVIIGLTKPDWCADSVDHIKLEYDRGGKFSGVSSKMETYCLVKRPFVIMNDDFILLMNTNLNAPIWYSRGSMQQAISECHSETYRSVIQKTWEVACPVMDKYAPALFSHTPFLVDKPSVFTDFYDQWPEVRKMGARSFRMMYGYARNLHWEIPPEATIINMRKDVKQYTALSRQSQLDELKAKRFISFAPRAVNNILLEILKEMFPSPCKYER